jgi:pyruvate dehydrogenase E2 component (dihydrolipoamide acetyltransferase)
MTHQFLLPDLGEGLTEAEIVRWLVRVGETVTIDQPVVEVETAKATVEVPSPYAGEVVELHGAEGGVVDVGAPLISIGAAGAGGTGQGGAGSGAVLVGYGTAETPRRNRRPRRAAVAVPAALAPGASSLPATPTPAWAGAGPELAAPPAGPAPGPPQVACQPAVVSPVVRRLAREYGLDLTTLRGSGRGGLIVRADVDRARTEVASRPAPPPAAATPPAPPPAAAAPARDSAAVAGLPAVEERVPLRGLRRAVAEKLSRSRREIPDATTWVDVDATGLMAAREAAGVGILALMARFCVAGLHRFPELNSTVDAERSELVRLPHVNLGFAAQTDRGLVVPVIRDADRRSTAGLAAEIARLTSAARDGTLVPAELTGGTFTLNNYGVFGVDGSDAIINHPEAGILGIGRLLPRPWVVDGALAVRTVTQLSLSFDHRVCDGGVAGGFLRYVADLVESPHRLLRDI